MSAFSACRARAAALGYGLQTVLAGDADSAPFSALWLVCNTGASVQRRWAAGRPPAQLLALNATAPATSCGPLDDFCRAELSALLGALPHRVLFPHANGAPTLPLLPRLEAAGWLRPGPFMNTLHPRYGSWWAVRALIALDAEPDPAAALGDSPCVTCSAPCIEACPASAVSMAGWNGQACIRQRLDTASPCTADCRARSACPGGAEWRYDAATRAYHYGVSLATLRDWQHGH